MINNVVLVGRITKDPELKTTQSNISVVAFTLAVNRPFKDADGEAQADFISCVVWRKPAENLAQFCSKGDMIGVVGRIQTRSYETDEGSTRYVTEVIADVVQFMQTKREEGQATKKETKQEKDDFYETSKKLAAEEDLPF